MHDPEKTKTAKPEGEILFRLLLDKTFDAVATGDYRTVREMLEIEVAFPDAPPRKITANTRGDGNGTLLQMAAGCDHFAIVDLLISKGADVRATDNEGDTALHQAAMADARRSARALLAQGADPNARNNNGRTPLHFAMMQGDSNMALLLFENGADPNIKNAYGATPLIADLIYGQGKIIGAMINGANNGKGIAVDVDATTGDGKTMLHIAAKKGLVNAVADLLTAGANPFLRDQDGKTALSISYNKFNMEISNLLEISQKKYRANAAAQARKSHVRNLESFDRLPQSQKMRENWKRRKRFP